MGQSKSCTRSKCLHHRKSEGRLVATAWGDRARHLLEPEVVLGCCRCESVVLYYLSKHDQFFVLVGTSGGASKYDRNPLKLYIDSFSPLSTDEAIIDRCRVCCSRCDETMNTIGYEPTLLE